MFTFANYFIAIPEPSSYQLSFRQRVIVPLYSISPWGAVPDHQWWANP